MTRCGRGADRPTGSRLLLDAQGDSSDCSSDSSESDDEDDDVDTDGGDSDRAARASRAGKRAGGAKGARTPASAGSTLRLKPRGGEKEVTRDEGTRDKVIRESCMGPVDSPSRTRTHMYMDTYTHRAEAVCQRGGVCAVQKESWICAIGPGTVVWHAQEADTARNRQMLTNNISLASHTRVGLCGGRVTLRAHRAGSAGARMAATRRSVPVAMGVLLHHGTSGTPRSNRTGDNPPGRCWCAADLRRDCVGVAQGAHVAPPRRPSHQSFREMWRRHHQGNPSEVPVHALRCSSGGVVPRSA